MESCFLAERIQLVYGYLLLGLLALRGRGCTRVVLRVSAKPAGISLQLCLRFAVCFCRFGLVFGLFFFKDGQTLVAQERGSVIPGFPPQIFTDSQMPKLLQKAEAG